MHLSFKKIFFLATFNLCLFILLIIGLQNGSKKGKINLIIDESVELPIGFIVGTSFISGSILGSMLSISSSSKR